MYLRHITFNEETALQKKKKKIVICLNVAVRLFAVGLQIVISKSVISAQLVKNGPSS